MQNEPGARLLGEVQFLVGGRSRFDPECDGHGAQLTSPIVSRWSF